ncbi:MAG: ATP-binding protein [Burkholderiaceae bacterium]
MSDRTILEVNKSDDVMPLLRWQTEGRSTKSIGVWMSDEERARYVERLKTEGHVKAFESQVQLPGGARIDLRIWAVPIEIEGEACILSCIANVTDEKRRTDLLMDIAKGMTGPTAKAFFDTLTQRMASSLGADLVLIGEITPDHCIQTLAAFQGGARADNVKFPLRESACEEALSRHDLSIFSSRHLGQSGAARLLNGAAFDSGVCQTLRDPGGQAIGVLAAFWLRPLEVTEELRALMAIFSSRATAELMRLSSERETEQLNNSLELRVQARTAELRKLNAELDSFAYSISHDLKSPLRAIDGFTQLLNERLHDRLDEEERNLMERVLGATHRMGNLMADLLDLTRVSQDAMAVQTVNLSQLASEIVDRLNRHTPCTGRQWQIQPGMLARCDPRLMRTALENLFENAQKFTRDQAQPVIEFGLDTSNTSPWYYVKDNGVGFSMAHANKLFKPFQRLHMPSAGFEGTGVGLATVRRIIERHGGSIHARGIQGEGAEFRFQLQPSVEDKSASPPPSAVTGQIP